MTATAAYEQVTRELCDDLRPYEWTGLPQCGWSLAAAWTEGTPYTVGPTETATILVKPDDYTIGPISARDLSQGVYRWVVVFDVNLTCREYQEVNEATKWTTYRISYAWG